MGPSSCLPDHPEGHVAIPPSPRKALLTWAHLLRHTLQSCTWGSPCPVLSPAPVPVGHTALNQPTPRSQGSFSRGYEGVVRAPSPLCGFAFVVPMCVLLSGCCPVALPEVLLCSCTPKLVSVACFVNHRLPSLPFPARHVFVRETWMLPLPQPGLLPSLGAPACTRSVPARRQFVAAVAGGGKERKTGDKELPFCFNFS